MTSLASGQETLYVGLAARGGGGDWSEQEGIIDMGRKKEGSEEGRDKEKKREGERGQGCTLGGREKRGGLVWRFGRGRGWGW